MALLTLLDTYDDGDALFEGDLENIRVGSQDFFNVTKINDGNFQDDGITASSKLADDSITGDKIASAVAGTGLSQDGSGNLQIADNGVTQGKLESKSVTTDGTDPGAGGVSISAEANSQIVSSGSYTDLTGFSVTLTTTGRPVQIILLGSTGNLSSGGFVNTLGDGRAQVKLVRDTTDVAAHRIQHDFFLESFGDQTVDVDNTFIPSGFIKFIDTPSAGTYTYKLQAKVSGPTLQVLNSRLMAREI